MTIFSSQSLNPGVPRREVFAWAMYDFANSGYTTVVLTAVFNAYFVGVVAGNAPWATLAWTVVLSALVCHRPAADAAARRLCRRARAQEVPARRRDGRLRRRHAALATVGPGDLWLAAALLVVSNFCYAAGVALNSAFLPELSRPEALGKVSGWGWSIGYVGGLAALGLCLAYVLARPGTRCPGNALRPGHDADHGRLLRGGLARHVRVPEGKGAAAAPRQRRRPRSGFERRVLQTLRRIRDFRDFGWLLLCGVMYQAGLSVVIALAAIYAQQVMGFDTARTMTLVLVVNVTAALGAFAFGYVQELSAIGRRSP